MTNKAQQIRALNDDLRQHLIGGGAGIAALGQEAVDRDINILSRLELLCKDVGRPLLMTGAFAAEVAAPVFEIGHFELRGFRQHQSLYGLCQDGEMPCT